jgi:hypothetical protein
MNPFNVKAAEAGRQFVYDHPRGKGVDIDDAAPKLNPARRHFQNAANDLRKAIAKLGSVFYRWEVKTTDDRVVGFCANSDEAQAEVALWMKLVKQDGETVLGYTIENQDGVVTAGMSYR